MLATQTLHASGALIRRSKPGLLVRSRQSFTMLRLISDSSAFAVAERVVLPDRAADAGAAGAEGLRNSAGRSTPCRMSPPAAKAGDGMTPHQGRLRSSRNTMQAVAVAPRAGKGRPGKTSLGGRRENPNHWRAITRRGAVSQVAHRHRRILWRLKRTSSGGTQLSPADDVLAWLTLAGVFAAYCATFWVLFPL